MSRFDDSTHKITKKYGKTFILNVVFTLHLRQMCKQTSVEDAKTNNDEIVRIRI